MLIQGSEPESCFGLGGTDENAGTTALGWVIERAPALSRELLLLLGCDPDLKLQVSSQVFSAWDRGFTDLELVGGTALFAIIEAKVGWHVPEQDQLARYAPRLHQSNARKKMLVSLSAADREWAKRRLPATVADIPINHISWSDVRAAARTALKASRRPIERLWLEQLTAHLTDYGMTPNTFDARVYVVPLTKNKIRKESPYTWLDVVEKDGSYFHEVGVNGFPAIPPAYIGFRWEAEFRQAHHVTKVIRVDRLKDVNEDWPDLDTPHFVYTLGPKMAPVIPMKLGPINPRMRNWIALDILLSGVADDYSHAIQLMKERVDAAGG